MESESAATLEFVISQTWKCLSVPVRKTRAFSEVFFDEESLSDIATAANITFAPGLLDVVQSPTPPSIEFFKSLPVKYLGLWAVYGLVLEKPDCPPLVYTGEASDARFGVPARWKHYENPVSYRKQLPSKVKEAIDAGYKITHKGVFAWYSIPAAKNVPRFRVLNYSMEVMFSYLFWTMHHKVTDYLIIPCCPWPRHLRTYGGLCSHNAFTDSVKGRLDLSDDQLELLAAQNKEATMERRQQTIAAKIYYCEHCEQAVDSPSELERHNSSNKHKKRVAKREAGVEFKFRCEPCGKSFQTEYDQECHETSARHEAVIEKLPASAVPPPKPPRKVARRYHRRTKAEIASEKLHCEICDLTMKKPYEVPRHNNSTRHKKRVAELEAGGSFEHRCPPCGYSGKTAKLLDDHFRTEKHKKLAAKRKNRAASETRHLHCLSPHLLDNIVTDGRRPLCHILLQSAFQLRVSFHGFLSFVHHHNFITQYDHRGSSSS